MVRWIVAILMVVSLLLAVSRVAVAEGRQDFMTRGAYGHPLRIVSFFASPPMVILDNLVVYPVTYLACHAPALTGCTPEERRFLGIIDAVYEQEAQAREARQ